MRTCLLRRADGDLAGNFALRSTSEGGLCGPSHFQGLHVGRQRPFRRSSASLQTLVGRPEPSSRALRPRAEITEDPVRHPRPAVDSVPGRALVGGARRPACLRQRGRSGHSPGGGGRGPDP